MVFIGIVGAGLLVSLGFLYKALNENALYYQSPTQVVEGEMPLDRRVRIGGLVVEESIERIPGSMTIRFLVTDLANTIPVEYTGVLPDLFSEGHGVVTQGHIQEDGSFVADSVLAKHDETYMSPEVAESLAIGEAAR